MEAVDLDDAKIGRILDAVEGVRGAFVTCSNWADRIAQNPPERRADGVPLAIWERVRCAVEGLIGALADAGLDPGAGSYLIGVDDPEVADAVLALLGMMDPRGRPARTIYDVGARANLDYAAKALARALGKEPIGPTPRKCCPRVELGTEGDRPIVEGRKWHGVPNDREYAVLRALADAGQDGLTTAELVERSGIADAVAVLRRLRKRDPEYWRIIQTPGRKGQGTYRFDYPRKN